MAEDTIPRPIRYRFLEQAQSVCDLAKVDYWEYSELLSSFREQMEASYRVYDQAGLYKDEAEAKALEDFGDVEAVARVHRDGWRGLWHRLLFNQRYSVHRLIAPVLFCMFHVWYRTTGSLQITILGANEFMSQMVLFGWNYFIGVFTIGIIVFTRLITRLLSRHIYFPRQIGEVIAMAATVLLFVEIAQEWSASVANWFVISRIVDDVPRWKNNLVGTEFAIGYFVEALLFFVVFFLVAAEVFDVPACQRAVIEAKRKKNPASSGWWALMMTNCFKVLDGHWRGLVWGKVAGR